ncbi:MAG: hypothetical protein JRJ56_02770 [Deltaproteobacteria bacterium]|nr:hypothetical protein [Deltaproteobacteria bacterium]
MSIAPEKRRRVVRTGLIFLWLACLALLRPPLSLATGTRGNASVGMVVLSSPRAGGRVGDPIPCRLEITVANQARLDPGSLAQLEIRPDKLPGELYRSWLPASGRSAAAAGEKIVLRGKITIYAPGQYRISTSPLVCRLRDENGKTRLVDLPVVTLTVKIAGLQPELAARPLSLVLPDTPPPRPPRPASRPFLTTAAGYAGILCLLAALFCGLGVYCEWRRPAPASPGAEPPAASPRERLEKLLTAAGNADWQRLVAIDHELRAFLLAALARPALRPGGSGRHFAGRLAPHLEPEKAAELALIWTEIDRLVAAEGGQPAAISRLCRRLAAWLATFTTANGKNKGKTNGL